MNMIRMMAVTFFASAIALTGALPAEAATARVMGNTQVRSGPSISYRVVGQLRRGDRVNVSRCSSSRRWCHVQARRTRNGWVNSRFLDRVSGSHGNRPGSVCFYGAADIFVSVDGNLSPRVVFQVEDPPRSASVSRPKSSDTHSLEG